MNETDKILKRLDNPNLDCSNLDVDGLLLNMIIDLNERLKIFENRQKI